VPQTPSAGISPSGSGPRSDSIQPPTHRRLRLFRLIDRVPDGALRLVGTGLVFAAFVALTGELTWPPGRGLVFFASIWCGQAVVEVLVALHGFTSGRRVSALESESARVRSTNVRSGPSS
jgi:hypothetical protein